MDREDFSQRVTAMRVGLYRCSSARHGARQVRPLSRQRGTIQRRQRRVVPVEQMPESPVPLRDERAALLEEALGQLPQRARTMVVLHYMEGYDVRQIARMMGTTRGAVCSGLSRARDMLRALIGEDLE